MKIALEHRTTFRFDRPIAIGPHVIRLRPAPHSRTPVEAYSLTISRPTITSTGSKILSATTWHESSSPARPSELEITVGLVADMGVINPFDFFVEDYAETYPSAIRLSSARSPAVPGCPRLRPRPAPRRVGHRERHASSEWAEYGPVSERVERRSRRDVAYSVRMEPGVHTPDETLTRRIGSCRDSAWL